LKFCKLEYYTEKYIRYRSNIDVSALFLDKDSEEESDNEKIDNKDNKEDITYQII